MNSGDEGIGGRVFAMDDKFSFLGYYIRFIGVKNNYSSDKIPLNLDGTFKIALPEGEYDIKVYDGDSIVDIDEKSPSLIKNDKIWIDFFNKSYKINGDLNVTELNNRFNQILRSIDYLNDYSRFFNKNEILEYVTRLMEIIKIDENALMQTSIYLDYLNGIVLSEKNDLNFLILLKNVENKINVAKRKNYLMLMIWNWMPLSIQKILID